MSKPRILFCGDGYAETGFSRVAHNLLGHLYEKYEIHHMAVNYFGMPHRFPWLMYPAMNPAISNQDALGVAHLRSLYQIIKPDLVILFNDLWVINSWYQTIADLAPAPNILAYFPVDAPGYNEYTIRHLNKFAAVATYTNFGARVLKNAGWHQEVAIVSHGINPDEFYPVPKVEARQKLGIRENVFLVLNANRNQPRKRIDLTIKGFCEFAEGKPDTYLYLHMGTKDVGWNVETIFERECAKHGIESDGRLLMSTDNQEHPQLPIAMLRLLFSCADVNVNTSVAEGWGLCTHESAACGVAQIIPNHSGCADVFGDVALKIAVVAELIDTETGLEHSIVDPSMLRRLLSLLYYEKETRSRYAERAYEFATQPKFSWDAIAAHFDTLIQKALAQCPTAPS